MMMNNNENGKRCAGIELFRCLLMFAIVLHHAYIHGIFGPEKAIVNMSTAWWSGLFAACLSWHVDGFIVISGWFSIRFSWKKFLSLWGVIFFYGLVNIGCSLWLRNPPFCLHEIDISGGWFGSSYLMLILFTPFLNASVMWLAKQGRKQLITALLLLSIGMLFSWFPRHGFSGICPAGVYGHSFFVMVFIYLVARSLHELIKKPLPLAKLIHASVVFPFGIALCSCYGLLQMLSHHRPINGLIVNALDSYAAPHVWIFAIILFLIFLWHVKIPHWMGELCRFMGPSIFAIYLIHDVIKAGRSLYLLPESYLFRNYGLHPVICIILSAVLTFMCCLAIDGFRRMTVGLLKPKVLPLLNRIDERWERLFNHVKD